MKSLRLFLLLIIFIIMSVNVGASSRDDSDSNSSESRRDENNNKYEYYLEDTDTTNAIITSMDEDSVSIESTENTESTENSDERNEEANWNLEDISKSADSEIAKLERTLSKEYPIVFKLRSGQNIPAKQVVTIKNCRMDLKTFGDRGLLFYDRYNLIIARPYLKVLVRKGLLSIAFGIKPQLKDRTNLYFTADNNKQRKIAYWSFKRLQHLCHRFHPSGRVPLYTDLEAATPADFTGMIPWGSDERGGRIHNNASENNKIAILTEQNSFLTRYYSILTAKKSIYAQYLIYRGDQTGKILTDALIKRKTEGLDVKVIIDGLSNFDTSQGKRVYKNTYVAYNNLMAAGIRVFGYSCGGHLLINEFRGLDLSKLFNRAHEKLWIIDGDLNESSNHNSTRLGIVGGLNIGQEYFRLRESGENYWRDQDVAVKGDIIKDMYDDFLNNFQQASITYKTYADDYKCFNPYDPIGEKENYLKYKRIHTKKYLSLSIGEEEEARTVLANIHRLMNEPPAFNDFHPVKAIRFIDARPNQNEHYIKDAYREIIGKAKNEIIISNAYFVPYPSIKRALMEAAERGVKITIMTNSPQTDDTPMVAIVARRHYYDLATKPQLQRDEDRIKIFEWIGKRPQDVQQMQGVLHTKYMIIDRELSVVGSFNLDGSSRHNNESVLIYESSKLAEQLLGFFKRDLAFAREPSIEELYNFKYPRGHYSLGYRFQFRLGRLIERFL
ncbi:MAG: phosphatidylserine/phosphatidylglycerophosphate/cardiolipin synthase family protein [Oligoflexia bacterium]|nr:phosphatidylserine/phosphatidylglycerophosphate/cardiolipin synthase family protein [Oligoflexia bacterium]